MNWLASVQFVAHNAPQALFVDIGSTTTDIALTRDGKPQIQGFNDAKRLQTDELVYTGVVRTPLMALAQKIAFNRQLVNIAAEHFATTADVYLLTGDLAAMENMAETADGADKSLPSCAKRIARMVGMDSADEPQAIWQDLAFAFKGVQLQRIKQAALTQISRFSVPQNMQIIGCGAGDFLVADLARALNLPYCSVTEYIQAENLTTKKMAAVCFPAFAVASLGNRELDSTC